jgi:ArsR family transcriptional regulator
MIMAAIEPTIALLHLFGDPTRLRLLALLSREELSVIELTSILDIGQSRVSTHLGKLREAGLVRDRRVGASTFYAFNGATQAQKLWGVVREQIDDGVLDGDWGRAQDLKQSRQQALSWPDSIAGEMERHYSPGRTWEATARGLLGFVQMGDVLDTGSGDGAISQLIAPYARSVTCLDRSEHMIEAARGRFGSANNVRLVVADMHKLPFDDPRFDTVLMFNVLTYAESPLRALREACRVLRPGGKAAVITLNAHSQSNVTAAYGHLHAGFSPLELSRMLRDARLQVLRCEVTSRERRKPYFEVVTAFAIRPEES